MLSKHILPCPAAAKSLQSCPTLCDPTDSSPPSSSVSGILQARTLEWAAISFSNAGKWKVKVKSFSHVWPSGTPCTAAHQAPLSMGVSRQEYWSGVPLPSPTLSYLLYETKEIKDTFSTLKEFKTRLERYFLKKQHIVVTCRRVIYLFF